MEFKYIGQDRCQKKQFNPSKIVTSRRKTRRSREIWRYEYAQTVIMKHHWGRGAGTWTTKMYFLTVPMAGKFQIKVLANSVPGEALFLVYRSTPSHHVLMWPFLRACMRRGRALWCLLL